jgi:hypothetical protein
MTTTQLDELEHEIILLRSLLKDRQPGLHTWNEFIKLRLRAINTLSKDFLHEAPHLSR